jgi:hypothetical protein
MPRCLTPFAIHFTVVLCAVSREAVTVHFASPCCTQDMHACRLVHTLLGALRLSLLGYATAVLHVACDAERCGHRAAVSLLVGPRLAF